MVWRGRKVAESFITVCENIKFGKAWKERYLQPYKDSNCPGEAMKHLQNMLKTVACIIDRKIDT